MNKSYVTPEHIMESAKSEPRIIYIPNALAGFMSDLLISLAKEKIKKSIVSGT